jgi:hypothetical protein
MLKKRCDGVYPISGYHSKIESTVRRRICVLEARGLRSYRNVLYVGKVKIESLLHRVAKSY